MYRFHRDQRGQSLVIVLSLITILFLLGSALAVHASAALRATRASEGEADDFYAADGATELGIWWQRNGKAGNPPAQTINGITTSTTITTSGGGGGSCPAAPTVAWMSGFEGGRVFQTAGGSGANSLAGGFAWVQSGAPGIVDVVASPARTGSYALRVAPLSTGNAYAYHDASSGTFGPTAVVHLAVRFGALPTTADGIVFVLGPSGSTGLTHAQLSLMYRVGTGKWALGLGNATTISPIQESTVTATVNTWYSFDIRFPTTASNIRLGEWYIDGVAQTSVTATDSASWTADGPRVAFGSYATPTSMKPAYTAYYDDVIVSTTPGDFPIGDMNLSPIRPDARGTDNTPGNFQQEDNTAINATSYQRIADSMTQTVTGLKQVTASATSYLETTLEDTTQTCIRAAAGVLIAAPSGTSANNTKTSIFDGATESIIYSGDISIQTTALSYAIKPITPGGAWTQARVNGLKLRFGYGSDISPFVVWHAVAVEVGWTTVAGGPATVTIVGTGGGSTTTTTYPDAGAGIPTLSTWTVTK